MLHLLRLGKVLSCRNGARCCPHFIILLLELADFCIQDLHGGILLQGCDYLHILLKKHNAVHHHGIHHCDSLLYNNFALFPYLWWSRRLWLQLHFSYFQVQLELNSSHFSFGVVHDCCQLFDLCLQRCFLQYMQLRYYFASFCHCGYKLGVLRLNFLLCL